jgi:hypothetical protein
MKPDSVPELFESPIDFPDTLQLAPSEIICLTAEATDSSFTEEKNWKRVYGTRTLVPIHENTVEEIEFHPLPADPALADTAFLEISYGRMMNLGKFPARILFNGDTIPVPENWAGPVYDAEEDFFTSLRVGIPVSSILLGEANRVGLQFPDEGGRIGSVNIDVRYLTPLTPVTFHVRSRDGEVTTTLASARIGIGDMVLRSGSDGNRDTRLPAGKYQYQIMKEGYVDRSDSLVVGDDPVEVFDTLDAIRSRLELRIVDELTMDPVKDAFLIRPDIEIPTDSSGKAVFDRILYGWHSFQVSAPGYLDFEVVLKVVKDTIITLKLEKPVYEITIMLSNTRTGKALPGVSVKRGVLEKLTDGDGIARFYEIPGSYRFTMEKEKFGSREEFIGVGSDTILEFQMQQILADVKFFVRAGEMTIENAGIQVDGRDDSTSAVGIAIFRDLGTGNEYDYLVQREEYQTVSGSFYLLTDTTILVNLNGTGMQERSGGKGPRIYPNPAVSRIWIERNEGGPGHYRLFDAMGRIILTLRTGDQRFSIDVSGFEKGLYYLQDVSSGDAVRFGKW